MSKTFSSLRALVESKTVDGITKLTDFLVDPDLIHIEDGWNGRDETPDLLEYRQRLKEAMRSGAAIPPIDVQMVDGVPVLRDGHSRTLMARELVAEGIPYKLQAREIKGNDAEMRFHMLGSSMGRPLSPQEQGRQFVLLVRYGETVASIAKRLGQHRSTVENGLKLAEMPAEIQKMVGAGQVASHTALKVVKAHGKEATKVLRAAVKDATAKGKKKATPKSIAAPAPAPKSERLPTPFLTLADGIMLDAPTVTQMRDLLTKFATTSTSDKLAIAALATEARALLGL